MWRDNTEDLVGRCRKKAIFIGDCEFQALVDGVALSSAELSLLNKIAGIGNSPVTRPAGAIKLHEWKPVRSGVSPESRPAGGQSLPYSDHEKCRLIIDMTN